jgi:hypothetical protein
VRVLLYLYRPYRVFTMDAWDARRTEQLQWGMRTLTVPMDDPVKTAQLLRKHFDDEALATLIKELVSLVDHEVTADAMNTK